MYVELRILLMKGLRKYIKKHGRHFTIDLAHKVMGSRWSFHEIDNAMQKKVYYNVSGCTPGDIVYYCNGMNFRCKRELVSWLMVELQDVGSSEFLFPVWLQIIKTDKPDFDFTPYI